MKAIVVTDQAEGTAGMTLDDPSRRQRSTTSSFRFMRRDSSGPS